MGRRCPWKSKEDFRLWKRRALKIFGRDFLKVVKRKWLSIMPG